MDNEWTIEIDRLREINRELLEACLLVRSALAKNLHETGYPGTWSTELDDMLVDVIFKAEKD